jgi:hypothetical protein
MAYDASKPNVSESKTALLQSIRDNFAALLAGTEPLTELNVDNLKLNGNTMSSTDTNGDILLAPDGTGKVGIGEGTPLALLHLKSADAGAFTPDTTADEAVFENDTTVGISLVGGVSNACTIAAGDAAGPARGKLIYGNADDSWQLYAAGSTNVSTRVTSLTTTAYGYDAGSSPFAVVQTHNGYLASMVALEAYTAATSGYNFLLARSDTDGSPDVEFRLSGDGNGTCDGSWTGGGADYAEYFESVDGEEIPVGTPVMVDGENVREALTGEEPDGVISANASVVGNAGLNWKGKYQKDAYGRYLTEEKEIDIKGDKVVTVTKLVPRMETMTVEVKTVVVIEGKHRLKVESIEKKTQSCNTHDVYDDDLKIVGSVSEPLFDAIEVEEVELDSDGKAVQVVLGTEIKDMRILSPEFDPSQEFIAREDRDEWNLVGLVGQIAVTNGKPIGSRWKFMKEISHDVSLYLVR